MASLGSGKHEVVGVPASFWKNIMSGKGHHKKDLI